MQQQRSFSLPDDEQVLVLERAAEFKAYKKIIKNLVLLFDCLGVAKTKNLAMFIDNLLVDVANVYDVLIQTSFSSEFIETTVRTDLVKKSHRLTNFFFGPCEFPNEHEQNKFQIIIDKYTEIQQFHDQVETMKYTQRKLVPIPVDIAGPLITLMQDMLVLLDDLNNLPFSSVSNNIHIVDIEDIKSDHGLTTTVMPKIAKHVDEMMEFIQARQDSLQAIMK